MRFKLKRKTVDIRLKAYLSTIFGGDGRDRGGKPLAFASQIPDYMSLVLRQGEPHETD